MKTILVKLNESEKKYWMGLHLTQGVGATIFWRLIDTFGCAEKAATAKFDEIKGIKGVDQKTLQNLADPKMIYQTGERQLLRMEEFGGYVIFPGDSTYPHLLQRIPDPPPVLFARGNLTLLQETSVAIVGSRAATHYGKRVSYLLAQQLSNIGFVVVSGLALGIDSEAHSGALSGSKKTIGVLGCGLDMIYPYQNKALYQKMSDTALLLSEYPLGTRPDTFRFPARNRIIAGLSKGVIVVEAARKSGSLITAQMALDFDREVFAVPGQVDSFKSEGTHWLIKQGAKLVQNMDDVVDELGADSVKQVKNDTGKTDSHAEEDEMGLMKFLEPYPVKRDILIERCGMRPETISEELLLLELDGKIEILPGDEIRKLC